MIKRLSPSSYRIEVKVNYYDRDGNRKQIKRGPTTIDASSLDEAKSIAFAWKAELRAKINDRSKGYPSIASTPIVDPAAYHRAKTAKFGPQYFPGIAETEILRINNDCAVILSTTEYHECGWQDEEPLCFGNLVRITVSRKHRQGVDIRASGHIYRRLLKDCADYSLNSKEFCEQFQCYLCEVEEEVSEKTHEPISNASYNRIIAIVRGCWNTAIQLGMVETNPINPIKFPVKKEHARNRTLTDREVEIVSSYLRDHHEGLYYAFLFCLKNPIGYGDLKHLRTPGVDDYAARIVRYNRRKTGVAACPIIYPELEEYVERRMREKQELLFDLPLFVRWHIDRLNYDHGVHNFCWHDIRHHAATWLARQGLPLHMIASIGGWSTVQMVERYHDLKAEAAAEYARKQLLSTGTHKKSEALAVESESIG